MRREATTRLTAFGGRARVAAFDLATLDWWDRMFGVDLIVLVAGAASSERREEAVLYKAAAERMSPRGALLVADLIEPQHPAARAAAADRWDALARRQADSAGAPIGISGSSTSAGTISAFQRGRPAVGADAPPGVAAPRRVRCRGLRVVDAGHAVFGGFKQAAASGSPPPAGN